MQYWLALLTPPSPSTPSGFDAEEPSASQQRALGWWALQFTPRVALLEEAVVAEVHASQRLFGGEIALRERICREALELGCTQVAWADNALAALALARCGVSDGFSAALPQLLDALPLQALSATLAHEPTLARLGCKRLGDLRALPRGGVSRRFGKDMLAAVDRAYGLRPQGHEWLEMPEIFDVRLELPGRVEVAAGLLFGARRLLLQMSGWLASRHAGVTAFTLGWKYDFHRGKDAPPGDQLEIRTADPTRHIDHFYRLLSENLAKLTLAASVEELRLRADDVTPLADHTASLLPDDARQGDSLQQLLERLSARLGADKVLMPTWHSDHRPEFVQSWQPAQSCLRKGNRPTKAQTTQRAKLGDTPQPTWLLAQPMALAVREERPLYQGALQFLAGPYRMESGWWDLAAHAKGQQSTACRDYFVVSNEHAGLLWIFRERQASVRGEVTKGAGTAGIEHGWYLHGIFG